MERITDTTITDETIVLDDKEFIDCQFVNCKLEYSGGLCVIKNVRQINCMYTFLGPAWHTITFLQSVNLLDKDPEKWTLAPIHPN
jgi:hypothetical protein